LSVSASKFGGFDFRSVIACIPTSGGDFGSSDNGVDFGSSDNDGDFGSSDNGGESISTT
jgi:hypothetical protein